MSHLKRILPQLRLACLLTILVLGIVAADRDEHIRALEGGCEAPADQLGFRVTPPVILLPPGESRLVLAETKDGELANWSIVGSPSLPVFDDGLVSQFISGDNATLEGFGEISAEITDLDPQESQSVTIRVEYNIGEDLAVFSGSDLLTSLQPRVQANDQAKGIQVLPLAPRIVIPAFQESIVFEDRVTTVQLRVENVAQAAECSWRLAPVEGGEAQPREAGQIVFNELMGESVSVEVQGGSSGLHSGSCRPGAFIEFFQLTCPGVPLIELPVRFHNVCSDSVGTVP